MQADVFPLIIVNVDRDFRLGLPLGHLDIGLDYIVLTSGRHALGEFPVSVGHQVPLRLFAGGSPNRDGNTSRRMLVRPPHRAVNQRIVIFWSWRSGLNNGSSRNQEQEGSTTSKHSASEGAARQLSSHHRPLFLLLPRLLPRPHPRCESVQEAPRPPLQNRSRIQDTKRFLPRLPRLLRYPDRFHIQDK